MMRSSISNILVQERRHVLLDGQSGDLLHDPHHVLLLAISIQINSHPLTTKRAPPPLTWLLYVPLLCIENTFTHVFGSLDSMLLTWLLYPSHSSITPTMNEGTVSGTHSLYSSSS